MCAYKMMLTSYSIANYSRELADYIIYVIDVAGGDKVPRKGGPGISQVRPRALYWSPY